MKSTYEWAVFKLDHDNRHSEWDQISIWFTSEGEALHYKKLASRTYTDNQLFVFRKELV